MDCLTPVRGTPFPVPAAPPGLPGEPGRTIHTVSQVLDGLRWPRTGGGGLAFEAGGYPIWIGSFEFLTTRSPRHILVGIHWDGDPFKFENALQIRALTSLAAREIIGQLSQHISLRRISNELDRFFDGAQKKCAVPTMDGSSKKFDLVLSIQVA